MILRVILFKNGAISETASSFVRVRLSTSYLSQRLQWQETRDWLPPYKGIWDESYGWTYGFIAHKKFFTKPKTVHEHLRNAHHGKKISKLSVMCVISSVRVSTCLDCFLYHSYHYSLVYGHIG